MLEAWGFTENLFVLCPKQIEMSADYGFLWLRQKPSSHPPYFYSWGASFEFAELNHYKSKISNQIMILWSILIMQLWILHCPVALLLYTKNLLNFAFSKNNLIWIFLIISDLRAFDSMEIIMFVSSMELHKFAKI